MDTKVIFYIILFVGYYAFQAYRKLKKNAEEKAENLPLPQKSIIQQADPFSVFEERLTEYQKRTVDNAHPVFETYEQPEEYVPKYVSLEDMSAKNVFFDDEVSNNAGISKVDLKESSYFVPEIKRNKNRELIINNLKIKGGIKSAFLMQEVFQRKF